MANTEVVIRNVLSTTIGAYSEYSSKVIALVFKMPTGLVSVNGVSFASIPQDIDGNLALVGSRIELETENTYGLNPGFGTWDIDSTFLARFTLDAGVTWYIVVFGYISAAGTAMTTIGTAGDDITLLIDDASIPTLLFDVRIDGIPSRSDCAVVQTTYQEGGYNAGELPVN